ncbi:MAG TPA: response regulator [Candidatus Binatia bacterium]|jgi:CheY-like chemotaxis protein
MDKKKILIVEDISDCRELLTIFLRRSGYEIIEASTGLEAIEQARATSPDLVIMDLGLPGINGDEATARLKADPITRDIPVIINTAFHKGAIVEHALAAGAAEILQKPIGFKTLLEAVRRYLPPVDVDASHAPRNPRPIQSADTNTVTPS